MFGGPCAVTPKYIRAIVLNNKTSNPIEATCKFNSLEEEKYTINPQEEFKIEKLIDQGSFKCVDPIENLTLTNVGNNSTKSMLFCPQGVEIYSYDILPSDILPEGFDLNLL